VVVPPSVSSFPLSLQVGIFGPPDTIYQGGYFKAELIFPSEYPMKPPTMKFLCPMWHPNVYENGNLCISILHPPGEDEQSGELASERWNPTQCVRTILLSVISLLTEGNISSPANVEASVQFRKYQEGTDDTWFKKVEAEVKASAAAAVEAGIIVPTTVEDYCIESKSREIERISSMDSVASYGDDDAGPSDFDYDTTDDEFDDSYDDGEASSPMHATGGGAAAAKEDEGIAGQEEMDAEMAGGGAD
jgi:ubiquitin-conjugating enzyme E2 R